jgi:hypothetical protein
MLKANDKKHRTHPLLTYLVCLHMQLPPRVHVLCVLYLEDDDANLAQSMGDINTSRPKRNSSHSAKA